MDRRTFLKWAGCGAAACALAGPPVQAAFIEPRWIQVTRHKVALSNFPSHKKPLTIVQMSDFHSGPYMDEDRIRRAVEICNGLNPDVVALTGDFVSRDARYAASCARALAGVHAPLGVFAVLGNHDYWEGAAHVQAAIEGVGIPVITNRNKMIAPGVHIVGLDDEWEGRPDAEIAFAGVPEDAVQIAIAHSPKSLPRVAHRACLLLTGHTHGGQVDIRVIPRNKLPGLLGWKYIKGWYSEGRARMYVNRGLGVVAPPVRFLCRPEITVFECGGTSA